MDGMDTTGNKRIYMYIIDYTTTIGSRIVRNHVEIELWCRLLHFNGYQQYRTQYSLDKFSGLELLKDTQVKTWEFSQYYSYFNFIYNVDCSFIYSSKIM